MFLFTLYVASRKFKIPRAHVRFLWDSGVSKCLHEIILSPPVLQTVLQCTAPKLGGRCSETHYPAEGLCQGVLSPEKQLLGAVVGEGT